ncbi:hypothetical protein PIB30_057990 [Stylosanthes scabra]|uniref:Retrotransposon gag domain-containing protein n=1 Tax=Stylosanthes scabra TaxID=79078 RepID=A0ABU6WML0_9FABA|nr:hypothetical protein [Stylosanthes scabra]
MAEGTRLGRLEEMNLSNKHEIATLNRGLIEANEPIAENQTQLNTIEQLLRDCLDAKPKSTAVPTAEVSSGSIGAFNFNGDTNRPWKLKVADLPMCDGEGIGDWVFRAKQYLETFGILEEQRIRVLSFHLVGAAYAWYR